VTTEAAKTAPTRSPVDCVKDLFAKTFYIAKKEMKTYFVSPIAYIICAAYLFISGYMFTAHLINSRRADLSGFLGNNGVILLLMVPILTMRLLAEERKQHTMELLMTSPVTPTQIVLGKYVACLTLLVGMIGLTGVYAYILHYYEGKPDWGPIKTGYLGLCLLASVFVAVGLFTSSTTDNQLVAAVVCFAALLLLWIASWSSVFLDPGWMQTTVEAMSLTLPYMDLVKGVAETRYFVYYLSLVCVFLFASVRMLEASRWRS
jgi:ABC-2 type transport system permease protein